MVTQWRIYFMTWQLDPIHSHVAFAIKHLAISTARGTFDVIRGKIEFDEAHPENASIEAEADVASINTRDKNRDAHLLGAEFFDVEKYPLISFKSTKVERAGDDYKVTGDLTLHGVTRPVVFDVEYGGTVKDPWGLTRLGVNGRAKISRKAWGMNYGIEAMLGDEVKIEFELEATEQAVVAEAQAAEA
jgi:polyisoprenoid-binding protein YceI